MSRAPLSLLVCIRIVSIAPLCLCSLLLFAFSYLSHRLFGHVAPFKAALGKCLLFFLTHSGPTATKFGQALSTRHDLLDPTIIGPLSKLCEQNNPPSQKSIARQLGRIFPNEPGDYFEDICLSPIACGAVAYVLRANSKQGDPLAIKVVRDNIRRKMEIDVEIIRLFLFAVQKITRTTYANHLYGATERLKDRMMGQCNMRFEAYNCERLTKFLSSDVKTPRIIFELLSPDALVMEFVDQRCNLLSKDLDEVEFKKISKILLYEIYRMVFVHGIIHGDLHPGNIVIDKDGKLFLLDFGLLSVVSEYERLRFRKLFFGLITGDSKLVATIILQNSITASAFKRSLFEQSVDCLVTNTRGQTAGEFLVVKFVSKIFAIQRQCGLASVPEFINALWVLVMFEGLIRERFPLLKFQDEALPVLMQPYENRCVPTLA